MELESKNKTKIVIIGGGFGGLTVARALRKAPAELTIIDRRNHHLFQPLLYQVATAALSPTAIAAPIRSIVGKQKNTNVVMAEVSGIDPQRKVVLAGDREIPFDFLIVATGSWYSYFSHPEWNLLAPGLKSVGDATEIRKRILTAFEMAEIEPDLNKRQAWLTFVLVGGGPTGVEMAGSIAELAQYALKSDFRHIDPRQTRIILIEAGKRILGGFPEEMAEKAKRKLQAFGVSIWTGCRVEHIDESGVKVSGNEIKTASVIWCAGVVASPAGKWLQAATDSIGRVKVTPQLALPNHPDVFVIGDTACYFQDGKALPGVAPVAMQQGRYVANLLMKKLSGKKEAAKPFVYRNKGNLATVGRSFAVVDLGKIRMTGRLAWVAWIIVHIYYLIGFRNRVVVMVEWAWAYFTFQRGARLIAKEISNSENRS